MNLNSNRNNNFSPNTAQIENTNEVLYIKNATPNSGPYISRHDRITCLFLMYAPQWTGTTSSSNKCLTLITLE